MNAFSFPPLGTHQLMTPHCTRETPRNVDPFTQKLIDTTIIQLKLKNERISYNNSQMKSRFEENEHHIREAMMKLYSDIEKDAPNIMLTAANKGHWYTSIYKWTNDDQIDNIPVAALIYGPKRLRKGSDGSYRCGLEYIEKTLQMIPIVNYLKNLYPGTAFSVLYIGSGKSIIRASWARSNP
jgi:hypothetical protein